MSKRTEHPSGAVITPSRRFKVSFVGSSGYSAGRAIGELASMRERVAVVSLGDPGDTEHDDVTAAAELNAVPQGRLKRHGRFSGVRIGAEDTEGV